MNMWKEVVGYEGLYEVSSTGRVRSLKFGKVRYFKLKPNKDGYVQAMLRKSGIKKNLSVHRLVCEAFHGPAPATKPFVNHRNGKKSDNRKKNLHWVSASENILHALDTGLAVRAKGESHGMAKLTETQALEIYNLLITTNMTQKSIALKYGVAREVVKDIKTGRSWNHITGLPKSGKRVFIPYVGSIKLQVRD